MINMVVEMRGFEEQIAKLRASDQVINREGGRAMDLSVKTIERVAKPLTPVGVSGRLRNSIGSSVSISTSQIIGKVGSTLRGELYPSVIEGGRRPGAAMPPPDKLTRWVQLRLRVPANQARGVAFTVARSIARKGIKGRRMLQRGFEQSKGYINATFTQALNRIAEGLSNGNR